MGFTRGRAGPRGGGFSQCDDCGLTFVLTGAEIRGGQTMEAREAEHGRLCGGPSTAAERAAREALKAAMAAMDPGVGGIHDVVDLEKYVEEQIEVKARAYAVELTSERMHEIREHMANHFSGTLESMFSWRFSGERGRRLLSRRRANPTDREADIYLAGAIDVAASLVQEMYWRIEDDE